MNTCEKKLSPRWLVATLLALVGAGGALIGTARSAQSAAPKEDEQAQVRRSMRRLPLTFEVNEGQAHQKVRFLSRGSGYAFYISPTTSYIGLARLPKGRPSGPQIPQAAPASFVAMRLVGADPSARVVGDEALPSKTNYLISRDASKWKRDLANYAQVRVEEAYPGIDVVYYGNQQELEHDFVVSPGASPDQVRLRYDNVRKVRVDSAGELVLSTGAGEIRQRKPIAYQTVEGKRINVPVQYALSSDNQVSFTLGEYDASRTLVIDPILRYSTFIGGTFDDYAFSIVLDDDRNAYITGYTGSFTQAADGNPNALPAEEGGPKANVPDQVGYPQIGGIQGDPDRYCVGFDYTEPNANNANARNPDAVLCYSLYDAFVTKLSNAGNSLVYSTYLGAESDDYGLGISIDTDSNVYVTGTTTSIFWPLINPVQTSNGGGTDAFVVKITPGGNGLVFSTYLGGSGSDLARGIAVDATGNTHLAGVTSSTDFPVFSTQGLPYQNLYGGGASDAFLVSLDSSGSAFNYSTYYGGNGDESGRVGAVNSALTYLPSSSGVPWQTGVPRGGVAGGPIAAWPRGIFFGEPLAAHYGADPCIGLAVDSIGNAFITGGTSSTDLPGTPGAFQTAKSGATDVFVAKFDAAGYTGTVGTYATLIGGSSDEAGRSIAVDQSGNAYVTGYTRSTNFPAFVPGGATPEVQSTLQGGTDAFIAKINNIGSDLVYSAYLGGNGEDIGNGVAVSGGNNAYVAGQTASTNFPTENPMQTTLRGGRDAFITKYMPDASALEYSTYLGSSRDDRAVSIAIDNRGQAYITGHTNTFNWPFTASRVMNFSSRTGSNYGPYPDADVFVAYLFGTPAAPQNLVVVDLQRTSISLAWSDVSDNEDGFEIERKLGDAGSGGAFAIVGTVARDVVTFTSNGLNPSTTYTFRVRGFNNDAGQKFYGPYSNQVSAETLPDVPAAPSGLTATPIDTSRIKLDWTDNANNEVNFKIERRRITAPTTAYAEIRVLGPNVVTFTDTGLTANTIYEYRIRASNSAGDSPYAGPVQATTLPNKPNTAPTNLTATAVSNSQIDLSWNYTRTDALGFKIDRSNDGVNFSPLRTTATPNITTFSDTGLPASTTFHYRVRAYNQSGDGPNSAVSNATTLPDPPADPTNLVLKLNGLTGVVGTWRDNSPDESGFRVEESTDDFATVAFAFDTQPSITSFQRSGLEPNTIYSYRVTAFKQNAGGRSNSQNPPEGRILIPPAAPTALRVTAHTATTIDLEWQDNNPVGPSTFKIERAPASSSAFVEIGQATAPTVGGLVTFQDTGLTANTAYKYRVYAFNTPPLGVVGGGKSAFSTSVVQWTLPLPASALTATANPGPPPTVWALLSWTENNTPDALQRIERRRVTAPAEADFKTVSNVAGSVTSFVDKTTLGNIIYEYRIIARNSGPNGDAAPSNVATVRTLPARPGSIVATVPTDGVPRRGRTQIDLSWVDKSGDPSAFQIHRSTDGVTYTLAFTTPVGATQGTVTGLVENTFYWFRIRGVNPTGVGDFSDPVKARTLRRPPVEPTGLTAAVRSDVEIFLTWEDNGPDEEGFRIERKIGSGVFTTLVSLSSNVKKFANTGLNPSTSYVYRVIAFNSGGDSTPSRTAGGKTAPAAPSNLALSNVQPTSVTVNFRDNAIDEQSFKLERKTGAGNFVLIATIPPRTNTGGTVTFTDTGRTSGVTYTYRVRASRGTLFSRYSNTATATTP